MKLTCVSSESQILRFKELLFWLCIYMVIVEVPQLASAATFTNTITISETNAAYDGQDIIVDGATVTIDGLHSFNSILLTNNAVLTHSPCTAATTHKLDLTVTNYIVVSSNSRIDVSGKGYLPGRTSGNTTNGAATGSSAGSHGGWGGNGSVGVVGLVYGDYAAPDDWGGGSGTQGFTGAGGGLVRLRAKTIRLDGSVLANGQSGAGGGGIWVQAQRLEGQGVIQARGGDGGWSGWPDYLMVGGGGGGRVALYAQDFSGFNVTNMVAPGGWKGTDNGVSGGAGTVYVRDTDETAGTLIIDAATGGAGWTPLGLPGTNHFTILDQVIIRGSSTYVRAEHPGLVLEFQQELRIEDFSHVVMDGSSLIFALPPVVRNGGQLQVNGSWTLNVPLTLTTNGSVTVSGVLTSTVPQMLSGGALTLDRLVAPQLILTNSALLTCPASTVTEMHKLEIEVSGTLTVSANSRIDVSGKGYLSGFTSGNRTNGAATGSSAGSHGGWGGSGSLGAAGLVYDDYADPGDWGGGSGTQGWAGAGGGLVRLRAQTFRLDGSVLANGQSGAAGGGIWVRANRLEGQGAVQARGGDGGWSGWPDYLMVGGGGGGRIAIYAADFSEFGVTNAGAQGGWKGHDNGVPGGAGTVYVRDTDEVAGTLIIDAATGGSGWIPLGLPGTNHFTILDQVIIRGSSTYVRAEHSGLMLEFQNQLRIENFAHLSIDGPSVVFEVAPVIRDNGQLDVTGPFAVSVPITVTTGGRLNVTGDMLLSVPLNLDSNALVQVTGALTSSVPMTVTASTLSMEHLVAPSVSLSSSAVLTCPASTASALHKLEVEVAGTLTVSANSRIDVSGKGYIAGRTSGNITNGAANGVAGGSYGGLGDLQPYWGGTPNAVYGDYADPDDCGSGGAQAAGGGLLRLHANRLVLDGSIMANGGEVWQGGGGSGGGVYVAVDQLAGTGAIQAGGGYYFGGGGRVAVYAHDFSNFTLTNITATTSTYGNGGAGTVYLRDTDDLLGTLIIDGGTGGSGWTPLGLAGTNRFGMADLLVIQGTHTHVMTEHPGLVLAFATNVVVRGGAQLTGMFDLIAPLLIDSGAVVNISGPLNVSVPITITNGGGLNIAGDLSLGVPWNLGSNALVQVAGVVTSSVPLLVMGSTLSMDRLVAPSASLLAGAVLTCSNSTATTMHKLEIDVAGTLTVNASSRIDVSGKGYVAGRTSGNITNGAANGLAGGSYGGLGDPQPYWGGKPNAVYGDYADPDDWGSGGAQAAGGGLLRLHANRLVLDGSIMANGNDAGNAGGGSGGGLYVAVDQLAGTGAIQAGGGNYFGGGGRVAVYAQDFTSFPLAHITATASPYGNGGAGTVYIIPGQLHTHVQSFQPSGRNGGFVGNEIPGITNRTGYFSNVFDHFTLVFNQPINTNFFNVTKVQISGPLGTIAPTNIVQVSNSVYRISFPLQSQNGTYRFTLFPTVLDAEGFQLDQNANGVPGETEDTYTFTLILDTVPPHITHHAPAGDIAGTVTNVDIWFSETIDTKTFSSANITILNPTNGTVSVNQVTSVGFNRFRISFPPQTNLGQFHVLVGTNITDLAGNQLAGAYDGSFNLVPVDLELTNVTPSTNQFFAGDAASVAWQGRNNSGAPLIGNWIDAVYLSPDPFWNITDTLVGTVQHSGGLLSNEVYSASLTFNVPGVSPANYYLIVRADLGNQTRETVETNNFVTYGPIPISIRQLSIGGSFAGTITPGNRYQYFAINVPAGESLRLTLDGQSGVNHLFVNYASIPTRLNADVSGTAANSDQTITLTGVPGGGTYYVLVSCEQVGGNGNYTLTADSASFFLTDFTPNRLVGGFSERFWVQILQSNLPAATITGVGFDEATTVEFVGTNGAKLLPLRKEFVSPSTLRLVLPVEHWPEGVYNVRVTKGVLTRVLTNILTVAGSGEAKLEARIISTGLSPGGGQTLYVEYANTGTRAMPTPLLKVSAYTNAVIVTSRLNRRPQDALNRPQSVGSGGGGGGGGRFVGQIPSYRFRVGVPLHTAQLMAVGPGANPGILQPGERGVVPVYFEGLLHDRGEGNIQFSVGSLTADDTTLVNCGSPAPGIPDEIHFPRHGLRRTGSLFAITNQCPEYLFTPDWNEMEVSSRPETADAAGWHAIWQNVITNAGPLWADYVMMMGDNMNHLAKIGQTTNDPAALFNFEILQATAALNPVRTLAGAVDASAPSPGFPIVFRRVYGQPILSRYKLGPLGRGWSHNWDISFQELTNFQGVVIHSPGGTDRFFGRYNDGSYTATGSDTGQLITTNKLLRLIETDQTVWQFNSANRLDYVQDPNGNRITCGYTGALLTSLTHTSGKQLLLQYNGSGRLTQITDPLGPGAADDRVTTYEYDGSGEHLVRVTAPGNRVTTYAYHTTGVPQRLHALTNVTHPDLTQDSFAYDAQGRLIQTSQNCCGGAQQVTYAYDSAGTVTVTDATGRTTQLLYGLGGQLAQVRDGEGRIVNFTYDDLAQLTQLLGPGGERYRYGYDGGGNLSGIEDPLRQANSFAYEPIFNRLAQVRDARGNALQYAYDNRGNLTTITYADNTRELFAYDARGNVVTSTNRRGGVITYAYNPAGQLTSKNYSTTPGVTDFTYNYDLAGNLTNATYWNSQLSTQETLNLQHDPATDRLTRIEYPGGRFFAFEYDAAGRRTRRADQDGHISAYLYDPLGRLARMTNELGQIIVNYDYDAAGRLSRKTLGNGVFTTYTYNQAGQVTQLVNSRADSNVLSSFSYTYDASGRRASMTTLAGTETYGYDPLGQLTSVTYPNGRVVNYAYDDAGNRTQVTDNGVPATYAANTLNQYTSAGAATFGYDLDGNLTNKTESATNTVYTYDIENRLIGVATPADTWTYTYDAFGNRITAMHNGQTTRYVIDPTGLGNVAAEYDGGGSLIARYEHGFGLLARTDAAGGPAFYTFSAIGHTSELTGPAGAVANAYAYDPFGLSLAKTETIPNPFEFVGEFGVMNEGNGLDFMRARFYSASEGRFPTRDTLGLAGGINFYAYGNNRPVSIIDPIGTKPQDWNAFLKEFYSNPEQWGGKLGPSGFLARELWSHYDTGRHGDPADIALEIIGIVTLPLGGEKLPNTAKDVLKQMLEESWPDISKNILDDFGDWLDPKVPPLDPNPIHKDDEENSQVVRSRDPNDKLGPSGYGSAGYLPAGGVMAYQIRFENQPSATAPAQRVTVTDTLDPNLDLSTFELTEIAFANQTLALPAGLNHYDTRLAFTVTNQTLLPQTGLAAFGSNSIVVDVQAALDVPTRVLTLTLTALDPNTGWYPEDPLTGFLYPNNTNHVGEGSISYLVRPKSGAATGTVITNRADIVFDYSDPIQTSLVFNTLDAVAPQSSIAALPAQTGRQFLVQWSGQDDPGGSGLASYDIYISTNGVNFLLWQTATTSQNAWFVGVPGLNYYFYATARDWVGNEPAQLPFAQAMTTVPTNAPVLMSGANFVIRPGNTLSFTNLVLQGTPVGAWHFSLGSGAPAGASVNPTNGVLHWTPTCGQASTTNTVTVLVTDSGRTNITDVASFTVAVGDCVQPGLGQQILLAGTSGRVPINLISSVPLTNLQMTLVSPPGRLMSFNILPIVSEICTNSVAPISNGLYRLNLFTCPGQSLIGTQQVAWLNFTAVTNQSSGFMPLNFTDLIGFQVDGTPVANFAPQSGRVVVVGEEPLLEMVIGTNRLPLLVLYGKPLPNYSIESRTNFLSVSWKSVLTNLTVPTNLFLNITPVPASGAVNFYRALRVGSLPPAIILTLTSTDGTNATLWFKGSVNQTYRIQTTPSLSPPAWTAIATNTAGTDGLFQFTDTNGWRQTQRYYRLVWP